MPVETRVGAVFAAANAGRQGEPRETGLAKERLRRLVRAERRRMSLGERLRAERGLCDVFLDRFLSPGVAPRACTVALYVSRRDEPGTRLMRQALAARGVRVLLPDRAALRGVGEQEVRAPGWHPDRFLTSRRSRAASRAGLAEADVVVVPALAADTSGARLGRGGDHYDRLLSACPAGPVRVAAVYDPELLDAAVEAVPSGPVDETMDAVLTPTHLLVVVGHQAAGRRLAPATRGRC